jgi:hypothetical protein
VKCQHFHGASNRDAVAMTIQKNDTNGDKITVIPVGSTTEQNVNYDAAIDVGPSGQIYVSGSDDGTVFISR